MVDAFEPIGLYDECSIFIDGIYAMKRKRDQGGDYDLVHDETGRTIEEVQSSLEWQFTPQVVPKKVIHDDVETTVYLTKSYKPYPKRHCKIENMCGIFSQAVYKDLLKGACVYTSTVFGMNDELYHTEGNITVVRNKAFFKGCR